MDGRFMKDEIIKSIRACLSSKKGKCTVKQLMDDYRLIVGYNIPYKHMGHRTLDEFLRSVDSLTVSSSTGGPTYVEAKLDEKSRHVQELVSKQRGAKKKAKPTYPKYQHVKMHAPQQRWKPKMAAVAAAATVAAHDGSVNQRLNQVAHRQYVKMKATSANASYVTSTPVATNRNDIKLPYSEKTNRDALLHGFVAPSPIVKKVTANGDDAPPLSPTTVQSLTKASIKAADADSKVWDSWTSSDDEPKHRRKLDNLSFTGDPLIDIYTITTHYRLPSPNFKVIPRQPRPTNQRGSAAPMYNCKLTVGEHTYVSYPDEFDDETAARRCVASRAVDDLKSKYVKRKSLLISTDQDVLGRIPELVMKHFYGIWKWQLEADYEDLYGEVLPLNWLRIVDTSPMISVEPAADSHVLRYCKPEEILQKGKLNKSPVSEVSVPTNTIDFSDDGALTAEIACVVSAREIWCRQIETAEAESFNAMITQFSDTYSRMHKSNRLSRPAHLSDGGYYAALADTFWHRVRAFEVGDDAVNCFFIDYGDEQLVSKTDIYQLRREFARHQAQAFICRLSGLEDLYEVSVNSASMHKQTGRMVKMEIDTVANVSHDPTTDPIPVFLYDIETGASINQSLIADITMDSASPFLDKTVIIEACVTHVEPNGDIYLNLLTPGFDKLKSLLDDFNGSMAAAAPRPSRPTPGGDAHRLYMARRANCGTWCRARIVDWEPTQKVLAQAYYVDHGNYDVVDVTRNVMYAIDQLSDVLSKFPDQAFKVRMLIDTIPDGFAEKINELMPAGVPVLIKYVEATAENVPAVKFFKRIGPNNELCSINDQFNFDEQKENRKPERLQRLISLGRPEDAKGVPSTGNLKGPALPKVGDFFDVVVPTAVNPWNFFVQPFDSNVALAELMEALQARYKDVTYSPMPIDDIQPGKIYASKHDDGKWYRTCVMKVINPGSISVFYCDFGYYSNLTLQQLIPLDYEFLELPYQAIKAKLHGIAPKQSKWTMEDCKYFQKLVCKKSFVSIFIGLEKDELYQSDDLLNLKLIDTSTEADIYIDEVLVKKGVAVQVDENVNNLK